MVEMNETFVIDEELIDEETRETVPKQTSAPQTQELLVDALAAELEKILSDIDFPSPEGGYTKINIFKQLLPFHEKSEKNFFFPYVLIKFNNQKNTDVATRQETLIILNIGLWYEDNDRQYQHYAYRIYNTIAKRFISNNFLDNFRCEPEFEFALSPEDEETYPAYFAAMSMKWMIPGIDRELDFWD